MSAIAKSYITGLYKLYEPKLKLKLINVWSKNGVFAGSVCWINTIKESKDKRLDSWGFRRNLKESNKKWTSKRIYRSKIVLHVWLQV